MRNRKAHSMGLGGYPRCTLDAARAKANKFDALLNGVEGIDPIEARRAERAAEQVKKAKAITFRAAAERYVAAHKAGWRSAKHADQWAATLSTHAYPVLDRGGVSVASIDTGLVMKVLEPLWTTKPETAARLRGRMEMILDWAKVRYGIRFADGENPARWRGHLDKLLPKRSKVAKVEHHAALPWREIGKFMIGLRGQEGVGALALEFAILTATRTSEVIGATWGEINLAERLWIIPADRMKAGREHRVPLNMPAIAILEDMLKTAGNGEPDVFIFPGAKVKLHISNMAMTMTLRRMKRDDLTVHGFRSTFRDWCAETGRPADIAEAALAHVVSNKTVSAYQRGDLLERRRTLIADWASHCGSAARRDT